MSTNRGESFRIRNSWLPLAVFAMLCIVVLSLWTTLRLQEQSELRTKLDTEAENLSSHINADLRNRIPALQRLARKWEQHDSDFKEEFISDAQFFISDVPGFQAIEWVDSTGHVRWVVPLAGNEKAAGLDLTFEKNRREALERSRAIRSPAVTMPVDLVQGGKGILVFLPIFTQKGFEGHILAVFRIQEWLDYVFSIKKPGQVSAECRISVLFDDIPVYRQEGWDHSGSGELTASVQSHIFDHALSIRVRPTDEFIRRNTSRDPELTAAFSLLLSILASSIVRLYQRAEAETRRSDIARRALEGEVRERRRVETELQRTLMRTDLATRAGGMGIWTWEISSSILTWNERMFELFGFPPDVKPTYSTWRAAVHPDDVAEAESLLQSAVQGKAVFDTEFRIVRPDGSVRHIKAAAKIERDDGGSAVYVTGLNWDVTQSKTAEEALLEAEKKILLLLNSTGEAIYGIDLDGNCTFANSSCARLLGYADTGMLLGRNMHNLIHYAYPDGKAMDIHSCRIYLAFREGRNMHVDDEVLWRADGTSFPAEYWSYPQRTEDRVTGAVVTFIDITDRKKMEAEKESLIQRLAETNRTLESLNAAKDRFFGIIAHDLRGPLGAFSQIAETLLASYESINEDKKKYFFKMITDSATETYSLLENLLEWSSSQRSAIRANPSPVDLDEIVQKGAQLFRAAAHNKNISISAQAASCGSIETDRDMLTTILRNLISNAVKFTPEGGSVTVSCEADESFVRLIVTDTGIGISPDTIEKLFSVESNISTRGTSGEKGTGLGLILCRELAEKIGGRIEPESSGRGSTFTLTLPRKLRAENGS